MAERILTHFAGQLVPRNDERAQPSSEPVLRR
jgi:hypothetical protein